MPREIDFKALKQILNPGRRLGGHKENNGERELFATIKEKEEEVAEAQLTIKDNEEEVVEEEVVEEEVVEEEVVEELLKALHCRYQSRAQRR